MSTKRILFITIFSLLFIAAVVGIMMLTLYIKRDNDTIMLPETTVSAEPSYATEPDALDRVEVTRENIQAVVLTLSRPDTYSRDVRIETFWDGGEAAYDISVYETGGVTSLKVQPPAGLEKHIIITEDTLYIWYRGDRTPYVGSIDSAGDRFRTSDEWQMLITYEDLLALDDNDIIDAGYTEYGDEDCLYAEYRSPLLGYTRKYYVSIELGLVTGAEEFDETGALVYAMTVGECVIGETDLSAFMLPDGTVVE